MSYLTTQNVQAWLQSDKYPLTVVDADFERTARTMIFGKLAQRYDTSLWLDVATTPALVISTMAMWVAAAELRQVVSEEDGLASHAEWLENRVTVICDDIVSGSIDLGIVEDTTSSLGGGPEFHPTDATTALADLNEWDPLGTPQAFSMNKVF